MIVRIRGWRERPESVVRLIVGRRIVIRVRLIEFAAVVRVHRRAAIGCHGRIQPRDDRALREGVRRLGARDARGRGYVAGTSWRDRSRINYARGANLVRIDMYRVAIYGARVHERVARDDG